MTWIAVQGETLINTVSGAMLQRRMAAPFYGMTEYQFDLFLLGHTNGAELERPKICQFCNWPKATHQTAPNTTEATLTVAREENRNVIAALSATEVQWLAFKALNLFTFTPGNSPSGGRGREFESRHSDQ